jgi:hypothetical protein
MAIVSMVVYVRASRRAAYDQKIAFDQNPPVTWRENLAKPILRPPILQANEVEIRPDEIVIGVEVGGRARAYRLSSFDFPSGHLVNDVIGDVPVSVSYCNLTRCVRIYTDPRVSTPLDAEVAGLLNSEMVIKLAGNLYFQRSGMPVEPAKSPPAMPYKVLTPTLSTWKEWIGHHPQTDVFTGGRLAPPETEPDKRHPASTT